MSKREIERKFKQLLINVEKDDFYKVDLSNRVNCYTCQYGHITKTIDRDAGVTSMMILCDTCKQPARSSFYRDLNPSELPVKEWFRPDLKKVLKLKGMELDHVLSGGLMLRKIDQT